MAKLFITTYKQLFSTGMSSCCSPVGSAVTLANTAAEYSPAMALIARHHGVIPNKDRPLVDRHAPKNGVG